MLYKEGQDHSLPFCKWDTVPQKSHLSGSHRASTSLLNLPRQVRMHIWLFSLPSLSALLKRGYSLTHLLLRARVYPSNTRLCTCAYRHVLFLCLSSSLSCSHICCFPSGHFCFSLLPNIFSQLARGLLQQVSVQSRPDWVLEYSVPLLPPLWLFSGLSHLPGLTEEDL